MHLKMHWPLQPITYLLLLCLCTVTFSSKRNTNEDAASQWKASSLDSSNDPPEGTTETTKSKVSVLYHTSKYHIVKDDIDANDKRMVASGSYTDSIGSAGWGALEIRTYPHHADERQMYAAGLVEGALTHARIRQLYINDVSLRSARSLVKLYEYFHIQDQYLRSHAPNGINAAPGSLYWTHVALEMSQLDGLTDGYNYAAADDSKLVLGDMWLLNMDGDVIDLERATNANLVNISDGGDGPHHLPTLALDDLVGGGLLEGQSQSFIERGTHTTYASRAAQTQHLRHRQTSQRPPMSHGYPRYSRENWDRLVRHGRCSSLIKVLPDYSDVFVAHATWADYSELLRIWKTYTFPLQNVAAKTMSFSSYAGMISSTDDWYITDQQLLVTETTTQVEDESILSDIDPHNQVVSWVRTMVANRLASDGATWAKYYVEGNSGTYNCEWMVFDYKLFEKGTPPKAGFFTMTEIIPGLYRTEDMTSTLLERGRDKCPAAETSEKHTQCMLNRMYWTSVNRPYWSNIRQRAGYPEENEFAANNAYFSFESNPRGRVFARDQPHIKTIQDMMQMIAYNDPHDAVQEDPGHGIAARYDLPLADSYDSTPRPTGALDFKVSCAAMVKHMMTVSEVGPTHEATLPSWRIAALGDRATRSTPVNKPFRWDDHPSFANVPHFGVPMELDFSWQIVGPGKLNLPQEKLEVDEYLKHLLR